MEDTKYGIINEVGDMGLGFTQLSEDDNEKVKESEKEKKNRNK